MKHTNAMVYILQICKTFLLIVYFSSGKMQIYDAYKNVKK